METFYPKWGLLLLFFHIVLSIKAPFSVTRDAVDRFWVDKSGCMEDTGICTRRSAVCHYDGSCMCRNSTPHYLNPKLDVSYGYLSQSLIDGCMSWEPVVDTIDPYNLACSYSFRPFQLVSSNRTTKPSLFFHSAGLHYSSCKLSRALVKYPGQETWLPLSWLSTRHVEINMTYVGTLLFGWKVSVPELEGLMIAINLNCSRVELNKSYLNETVSEQCLKMKVSGTVTLSSSKRITGNLFGLLTGVVLGFFISVMHH